MSSMSMFEVRPKQPCENIIYYLMRMSENSQIIVNKDFFKQILCFQTKSLALQLSEITSTRLLTVWLAFHVRRIFFPIFSDPTDNKDLLSNGQILSRFVFKNISSS